MTNSETRGWWQATAKAGREVPERKFTWQRTATWTIGRLRRPAGGWID